tara:strand:+ start:21 stop:581 length:561 start_codon:yes stop_codon:yes gene_type:complete
MAKFQKPICYNSTVTLFDIVKPGPFLSENRKENFMTYAYNDGGRKAAGYKGTTGDCVCRAIAIAAELPYQEVYDALAEGNATQRRSKREMRKPGPSTGVRTARDGIFTKRKWFKDYMKALGFEWTPTMTIGSGCTVHVKTDELPSGRLVLNLSRHSAAFIDGELQDTYDCSRGGTRCVYGYWRKVN